MSQCNVCGKESDSNVYCSSSCGASTYCYCTDCLSKGLEPYSALVGMGLFWYELNNTYKQEIALPTLNYFNKTIEQFNKDVEDNLKSYFEAMKQ